MCFSSPPSAPPPPPPPPVVRRTATKRQPRLADEGVAKARSDSRRRQVAFANRGGTLVTGAGGLFTTASTQKRTLLGQV